MRNADLAGRFADMRDAANDISLDQFAVFQQALAALQSEASATRGTAESVFAAMTEMLDGIEKIGEQEPVPPVQYVDIAAFARLINRVNGLQAYLRGVSEAIPVALAKIDNVPQP